MSTETNNLVYKTILDTKLAMKKLVVWEKRLLTHEKKIAKVKAQSTKKETKSVKKVTDTKEKALSKQEQAEKKAAQTKLRLLEKEKQTSKMVEAAKIRIYRSTAFGRMKLEDKIALKHKLTNSKTLEDVRETNNKIVSSERRKIRRIIALDRKAKTVNTGNGKSALAGAAGGGMGVAALTNPATAIAMGGALAVGGGVKMVSGGSTEFREIQQGAQLNDMSFNEFSQARTGLSAVSDVSGDVIADKFKDISDRQGEFLNESTYNKDKGQFEGGEGSILANILQNQGMNVGEIVKTMQQNPAEFLETVSKALQGTDAKTQTFAMESFASDLSNLVRGMIENQHLYQKAKGNAVQMSALDIEAAKNFNKAIMDVSATFSNMPLDSFKSFSSNLTPEALQLLSDFGEEIGDLASKVGAGLASILNSIAWVANYDFSGMLNGMVNSINGAFKAIFDGILSMIPNFMLPESLQTVDTNNVTPLPTTKSFSGDFNRQPITPSLPKANPSNTSGKQVIENNTTVVMQLDSETVAQQVVNTSTFDSSVDRIINAGLVGSR